MKTCSLRWVSVWCTLAMTLAMTACPFWPDHDQGLGDAPDSFIAQNADFGPWRSWPSVVVGTAPIQDGHPAGERRVFINQLVTDTDNSNAFAVGTIIVKQGAGLEVEGGTGTEIHAMVKRGGGFNLDGAVGWEWFELGETADKTPLIKWRGQEPPDGESYGCIAGACDAVLGQCNTCHQSARDNDFVLSPALTIGAFESSLLR